MFSLAAEKTSLSVASGLSIAFLTKEYFIELPVGRQILGKSVRRKGFRYCCQ